MTGLAENNTSVSAIRPDSSQFFCEVLAAFLLSHSHAARRLVDGGHQYDLDELVEDLVELLGMAVDLPPTWSTVHVDHAVRVFADAEPMRAHRNLATLRRSEVPE